LAQTGNTTVGTNPELGDVTRDGSDEIQTIDPRPLASSPALAENGATFEGNAPTTVGYRGAFGTTNWASGWSFMDENGYFSDVFGVAPRLLGVEVMANGDVKLTVDVLAAGLTAQRSNDLRVGSFADVSSTASGNELIIEAANVDPNADGEDYFRVRN
jgi:hypothetical protein